MENASHTPNPAENSKAPGAAIRTQRVMTPAYARTVWLNDVRTTPLKGIVLTKLSKKTYLTAAFSLLPAAIFTELLAAI